MKHHLSRSQSPQLAANTPPPLFVGFDPAQTTVQAFFKPSNEFKFHKRIICHMNSSRSSISSTMFPPSFQGPELKRSPRNATRDVAGNHLSGHLSRGGFSPQVVVYTYRWIGGKHGAPKITKLVHNSNN